jgi:hypothetical protein
MGRGSIGQAKKERAVDMRKNLLVIAALCAALVVGGAAIANAASTTVRAGNLVLTFGGTVTPKAMPKKSYIPVTTHIMGKIKTSDGTHPSALREVIVDIDKDVKLNPKGYPECKAGQLTARDTKSALQVCGNSVVGEGLAHVEVLFPESKPILIKSPLTVFNGGEKGGKITLLIHVFITVPVPAALVTTVEITRKGTGIHSVSKVPRAAGGYGSAIDFNFKLAKVFKSKGKKVGYFEARCPDGVFKATTPKAVFDNEANTPGVPAQTILKGHILVPCTPKG